MAKCSTPSKKLHVDSQVSPTVCFAGIDYHKRFSVVTLGDARGNVVGKAVTVMNDKVEIKRFFTRYPGISCAVESCRGYEWFIDYLKELGITVFLSNPYRTKLIIESRNKTDKVDSCALMQLLAKGYLPTCYQPTPEERTLRERLRWRASLVRQATIIKLRIHSLVDKENLNVGAKELFTDNGKEFLNTVQMSKPRKELLTEHLNLLDVFEDLVNVEQNHARKLVKQNPQAQLLSSIPGIGTITSLLLAAEIGDINRFRDSGKLASYFGMVPRVISSAGKCRVGPITKQGSGHVRWMLNQAGWIAIRHSEELERHYLSVRSRKGKQAAISSVSRKLIRIVFRVLKDQRPYQAQLVGRSSA